MKTIATAIATILLSSHIAVAAVNVGEPGNDEVLINNPALELIEEIKEEQIFVDRPARKPAQGVQTVHHYWEEEECYWETYYDAWLGIWIEELVCYY